MLPFINLTALCDRTTLQILLRLVVFKNCRMEISEFKYVDLLFFVVKYIDLHLVYWYLFLMII